MKTARNKIRILSLKKKDHFHSSLNPFEETVDANIFTDLVKPHEIEENYLF